VYAPAKAPPGAQLQGIVLIRALGSQQRRAAGAVELLIQDLSGSPAAGGGPVLLELSGIIPPSFQIFPLPPLTLTLRDP
jgi:hypothetical protein